MTILMRENSYLFFAHIKDTKSFQSLDEEDWLDQRQK